MTVLLLSGPDDSVERALKLLGPKVIAYHREDHWIAVQPSQKDVALEALKQSGIGAEETTF